MILIAERDLTVRALQRFFLERANLVVEFADDGFAVLERAGAVRPDVIVTEILLPKLDGLMLCRRLQDDPATRMIPVIVFSVLGAGARAAEAGAFAFVRKPLVESVFIGAVHAAIAARATTLKEQQ
jgi:CheY-like chemotaxis protein